jgi:hypothetical protein
MFQKKKVKIPSLKSCYNQLVKVVANWWNITSVETRHVVKCGHSRHWEPRPLPRVFHRFHTTGTRNTLIYCGLMYWSSPADLSTVQHKPHTAQTLLRNILWCFLKFHNLFNWLSHAIYIYMTSYRHIIRWRRITNGKLYLKKWSWPNLRPPKLFLPFTFPDQYYIRINNPPRALYMFSPSRFAW